MIKRKRITKGLYAPNYNIICHEIIYDKKFHIHILERVDAYPKDERKSISRFRS